MSDAGDQQERDALQMLTSVDDAGTLQQLCELVELQVPNTAVGKSNVLLKLLLRHLNSQEVADKEDGGLSLFLAIIDFLSPKVKEESSTVTEEKGSGKIEKALSANPTFDVLKLKDFKISGTIGALEKKDSLSHS